MALLLSYYSILSYAEVTKTKESQWLTDWVLEKNERGITAQCRQNKNKINQCKFMTISNESVAALTAVIADVDNFKQWAVSVKISEKMPPLDATNNIYVYTEYNFTGAYNRYAVTRYWAKEDPITHAIKFSFLTENRPTPHVDMRLVRFPIMAGYWKFTPLPNGKTQIEHMSFVPPGGAVQKTLYYPYNIAVRDATFDTIFALEKQARLPKYQTFNLALLFK